MGTDQPALTALFACVSGLSEPEIGLEHAFVLFDSAKEARQIVVNFAHLFHDKVHLFKKSAT